MINPDTHPHAATPFVKLIAQRIEDLAGEKTQASIGRLVGYPAGSTMIANVKCGISRLPMNKVPALARALALDPAETLRLWLESFEPELAGVLKSAFEPKSTQDE